MKRDWQHLEQLVQSIERSISPGSRVEHNVMLPHLNSPSGAASQCDVVIRAGEAPRETLTIVEVQSRRAQVKINEFLGWLSKMELVGAHRLICVSLRPFSSTIKEQAAARGGRVVLVVVGESGEGDVPLSFVSFILQYRYFFINKVFSVRPGVSAPDLERYGVRDKFLSRRAGPIDTAEKMWSLGDSDLLSMTELCSKLVPEVTSFEGRGNVSIEFENEPGLFIELDGLRLRAALSVDFDYVDKLFQVPMSVLSYVQDGHGSLGWIMEGSIDSQYGKVTAKIPIVPGSNGNFIMRDSDVITEGAVSSGFTITKVE